MKRRFIKQIAEARQKDILQEYHNEADRINIIKERIKALFISHIGESNGIYAYDIFEKVTRKKPEDVEIYKREYLWNIIKKIFSVLRREGDFFIIKHGDKYFVVQTEQEAGYYERELKRDIKAMVKAIHKCRDYAVNKRWKKLINYKSEKEKEQEQVIYA